jgi:hypothetical protein
MQPKKRLEALPARAMVAHGVEQAAGLVGVDDASRVNGLQFPRAAPRDGLERVAEISLRSSSA